MSGQATSFDEVIRCDELELTQKIMKEVREKCRQRQLAELRQACMQQRLAAAAGQERYMLDEGEVQMMIPPAVHHYWGQRLGYECWSDKLFVHQFLRDNPECRVKSRSRKIRVGFRAPAKRFSKTYTN